LKISLQSVPQSSISGHGTFSWHLLNCQVMLRKIVSDSPVSSQARFPEPCHQWLKFHLASFRIPRI
jgi:hypothetical protein